MTHKQLSPEALALEFVRAPLPPLLEDAPSWKIFEYAFLQGHKVGKAEGDADLVELQKKIGYLTAIIIDAVDHFEASTDGDEFAPDWYELAVDYLKPPKPVRPE